ncbi:DUF427 domain-containing protein [Modestobacter sp. SYSU DS0875]
MIARTDRAVRVCETSHPPVHCVPRDDVAAALERATGSSWCEFSGTAICWDVVVDGVRHSSVGWSSESPTAGPGAPDSPGARDLRRGRRA